MNYWSNNNFVAVQPSGGGAIARLPDCLPWLRHCTNSLPDLAVTALALYVIKVFTSSSSVVKLLSLILKQRCFSLLWKATVISVIERDREWQFCPLLHWSSRTRLRPWTTTDYINRFSVSRNGDNSYHSSLGNCTSGQPRLCTGTSSDRDWHDYRQTKTADFGRQIKVSHSSAVAVFDSLWIVDLLFFCTRWWWWWWWWWRWWWNPQQSYKKSTTNRTTGVPVMS